MQETELRHLATRATACTAILEIGSWQGRSSKAMAAALPPTGTLYCVDDWRGEQSTPVDAHELRGAFMSHLMLEIIQGKVIQYTASSQHLARMLQTGWLNILTQYDLIFIDGSHDKASVMADIRAYLPYVRPGGILAGHDWGVGQVKEALAEVLPGAHVVAGTIWEWRP